MAWRLKKTCNNKLNDSFVGLSADFHILCQPNEALVFMVVGINGDWKHAIGYFLIRGFSASKQASLIKEAIIMLHEIDIQVVLLTPDACSTNVAFVRELGCHFKPPLVNSFLHPVQPSLQVYVVLDACHMVNHLPPSGIKRDCYY
jgi:hypothetical protein